MLFRKKEKNYTRLFYATDLHGSETCFLKTLNAGQLYEANSIIVGGDVTGKKIIFLLRNDDGSYATRFLGQDWHLKNTEELEKLEKRITNSGFYPYRSTSGEVEDLNNNHSKMDKLFERLCIERLQKWCRIAKERLQETSIKIYMTGGNDDGFYIERVLKEDEFVIDPEDQIVRMDEHHEMLSLGYSNMTPWRCYRDISEEELAKKIDNLSQQVVDIRNCVFNIHVPPFESEIDQVPKLDTTTDPPQPIYDGGAPVMVPAGSTAVREAIEKHQPLLGIHGHIHESRGAIHIGRTLVINPGSEYGEGILRGIIINLEKSGIKGYQFVSG